MSCHLAQGEGSAIGPILSDIALTLTVTEVRDALLHPDARIAPGTEWCCSQRDGRTLRGSRETAAAVDLRSQDLTGPFHTLSLDDVASMTDEKTSHMPAVKASADETTRCHRVLERTDRRTAGRTGATRPSNTGIDFSRILNPKAGEWQTFNET